MTQLRRRFLHQAALAAAALLFSGFARAQTYPQRPVRVVVGFAPSGGNDIVARLLAQWLGERLGQTFFVENRPGGNLAAETVVTAPADGHTLLLVSAANAINASLFDYPGFNFIRDVSPVAGIMRVPSVILLHPSVQVRTLPEFIAHARQSAQKLNMASGGTGTSTHLAGELLKMMTGIDMVHVPYRGTAPAIADLLSGQVQVMFGSAPSAIQYIRSGALRALAVTSADRLATLPEIPAVAEFVPGYEATQWYGIGAPGGTPAPVIELLNREINAALADDRMKAKLIELGGTVLPGSAAGFARLIAEETDKWRRVAQFSKAKP